MDMQKIGSFLAELRAGAGLTQEQLGEEIGVTNKTVSRWERGNYLPPVEMLQILSERYNVSLNELLAGQRLDDENYRKKAEENIKTVLAESSFSYQERLKFFEKKWKKEHLPVMTVIFLLLLGLYIAALLIKPMLSFIPIAAALAYCLISYNKMRGYSEKKAYMVDERLSENNR